MPSPFTPKRKHSVVMVKTCMENWKKRFFGWESLESRQTNANTNTSSDKITNKNNFPTSVAKKALFVVILHGNKTRMQKWRSFFNLRASSIMRPDLFRHRSRVFAQGKVFSPSAREQKFLPRSIILCKRVIKCWCEVSIISRNHSFKLFYWFAICLSRYSGAAPRMNLSWLLREISSLANWRELTADAYRCNLCCASSFNALPANTSISLHIMLTKSAGAKVFPRKIDSQGRRGKQKKQNEFKLSQIGTWESKHLICLFSMFSPI